MSNNKLQYNLTSIIVILSVISFLFSFTNLLPISVISSICIIFIPYFFYKKSIYNKKLLIILLLIFIYFIISTVFYDYASLFKYGFYRRDGNIFITYAPLIILPLLSKNIKTLKISKILIWTTALLNVAMIPCFILFSNINEYFFMFRTHNAAGGYLSTIIAMTIGYLIVEKDKKIGPCLIINCFALFLTDSRGSMVGIILAIICVLIEFKTKFRHASKILFMLLLSIVIIVPSIYICNTKNDVLIEPEDTFVIPEDIDNENIMFIANTIGRSQTIVNRAFYLWPRAVKLFTKSPIIGTGFGSYNDLPYDFKNSNKIIKYFNNPQNIVYSDAHAHNSYLHILAETGIVGFIMIVVLLFIVKNSIFDIQSKTLKYGLYFAWLSIIFSSFTEHRLTTPSQVLPFTLLLGLAIAENNFIKEKNKVMDGNNKKLKNVVIVYDCNYVNGGGAKVAIDTARYLTEEDINVYFFSAVNGNDESKIKGVNYIYTNQQECLLDNNKIRGIINGIYNFKAKHQLEKLLDTLNPQETIIHVHGWSKSLSCSIFDALNNKAFKYVVTYHDYFSACPNGGYYNYRSNHICTKKAMSMKCILCNCDSRNYLFKIYRVIRQIVQNYWVDINSVNQNIVSISDFSYNVLKKTISEHANVKKIYNPIQIMGDKKIEEIEKNNNYICVGRVSNEKNVEVFCKAITKLKYKGIVVGDGNEKNYLEKKYPKINFVGWKNSEEVKEYMKNARCMIFPSKCYEGAPLSIIEAYSIGLPVISSNVGAGIEFVDRELTFDPDNVEELTKIILMLDDDETLKKYSLECYNSFIQNKEFKNYKNNLLIYYKNILSNKDDKTKVRR